MTANDTEIDRRSVLRTTAAGAAAVAGLGAAGTAAASDFRVGDCIYADDPTPVYEYGCPPGYQIDTAQAGTGGYVVEVCEHASTVRVDWSAQDGWVDERYLAHC